MGAPARDRASIASIVLAVAMCAVAASASRFWQQTREAWSARGADYTSLRTLLAFDRVPIREIGRRLDEILPPGVPVRLDPSLAGNGALQQRLSEGLYPRRIDRDATEVLALARDGSVRSPTADPSRPPPPVTEENSSFSFDVVGFIASIGALLGFGLAARLLIPALELPAWPELTLPVALLAGCAAAGAAVYVATFVQIGIPWWLLRLGGWVGLGWALARRHPGLRIAPETSVLVVLLALLAFRLAVVPVTGWDGRSVWLFHAKQIFFERKLALADLRHPDWEWSHPVYPFLVPAVMAMFGGAGRVFNERIAAMAMPVVWSGAVGSLWCLIRRATNRTVGALLTFTCFLALQGLAGDLYMDGLVAVLLTVMLLALADGGLLPLGVLAACVVSLVKLEAAVAAGLIAVSFVLFDRRSGRRTIANTAALLSPVVLPLLHRGWLSWHDISEFQARIGIATTVGALPARLPVLLRGLGLTLLRETSGQQQETQAMLRVGLMGILAGLVVVIARWRGGGAKPVAGTRRRVMACAGAGLVLLAVGLTVAMPQDAAWLVTWTLDRLLVHPALAFAMLPFL
jgi:hypothetical protein